jgi:hypothetical protein
MVLVSNGHRWALIRYFVTVSNVQRITTAGKHIHIEKIVIKYKYIVVLQNCESHFLLTLKLLITRNFFKITSLRVITKSRNYDVITSHRNYDVITSHRNSVTTLVCVYNMKADRL